MVCMSQDCTTQNIPTTQLCELHKCRFTKCNNEHNKTSEWCDKHWRQRQNQKKKTTKQKNQIKHQSQNSSPLIKTRAQKKATYKTLTQPPSPQNNIKDNSSTIADFSSLNLQKTANIKINQMTIIIQILNHMHNFRLHYLQFYHQWETKIQIHQMIHHLQQSPHHHQ